MKGSVIASWSPLEVGDTVKIRGWTHESTVTEIETVFSAKRNQVEVRHFFDGWMMPLESVAYRVGAAGEHMRIGRAMCSSQEVKPA